MKTFILIFTGLMVMFLANSQSNATEKMYDYLKKQEGVSLLSFSKDMIDMVDLNLDDESIRKKVTGPLTEVRLAICKGTSNTAGIKVAEFLNQSPFQFIDIEEEKGELKVFVNRKGKVVKECHITIPSADNFIMVSFFGDFKIEDLNQLKQSAAGFGKK